MEDFQFLNNDKNPCLFKATFNHRIVYSRSGPESETSDLVLQLPGDSFPAVPFSLGNR